MQIQIQIHVHIIFTILIQSYTYTYTYTLLMHTHNHAGLGLLLLVTIILFININNDNSSSSSSSSSTTTTTTTTISISIIISSSLADTYRPRVAPGSGSFSGLHAARILLRSVSIDNRLQCDKMCVYIYIYIYTYMPIYIYIYTRRERERERERDVIELYMNVTYRSTLLIQMCNVMLYTLVISNVYNSCKQRCPRAFGTQSFVTPAELVEHQRNHYLKNMYTM